MNIYLLPDGALWASWGITIIQGKEALIIKLNNCSIAAVSKKAGIATLVHLKGSMQDLAIAQNMLIENFLYEYFFRGLGDE